MRVMVALTVVTCVAAEVLAQGGTSLPRLAAELGPAPWNVAQWTFRPAWRANREVASRAFLVFSFVGLTP